jgi:ATP-dependent DNA helicase RecQ
VKLHERFLNEIDDPEVWHRKRQATVDLFELVEGERCRHQALVRHFDESIGPCGDACDVCTGQTVADRAAAAMARQGGVRRASRGRSGPPVADPSTYLYGGPDRGAFEALRAVRKQLADEAGVPAYIVFSDKVLQEMVDRRPATAAEMLDVPGVGPAKLERYGAVFLEAVARLPAR